MVTQCTNNGTHKNLKTSNKVYNKIIKDIEQVLENKEIMGYGITNILHSSQCNKRDNKINKGGITYEKIL